MKSSRLALITIILLAITQLQVVDFVSANFVPIPSMIIEGPSKYVDSDSYSFEVEVHVSMDAPAIVSINYSIDESENITSTNLQHKTWFPIKANLTDNHNIYSLKENLTYLSNGNHALKVYSLDANGGVMSDTRTFIVANSISPSPTQTTVQNDTAITISIALTVIAVTIIVVSLAVILYKRKKSN